MRCNVIVVGLGYFSQFHVAAWNAHRDATLVAACDPDVDRHATARSAPAYFGLDEALTDHDADIIDIVAPPSTHAALIRSALRKGRIIICQKPFCTSVDEARQILFEADAAETTLVVHENFRFQPWHREIKAFLDSGQMGEVWQARFALRPGDGRGPDAYRSRQPAFQTMPRLLIHETAVHFIDLFRWMFGPVSALYCDLKRRNPVIQGEDAGILIMDHTSAAQSLFDGNRLSDQIAEDPRRTMGNMTIEGEAGCLSLDAAGRVWLRDFGAASPREIPVTAPIDTSSFGGGCVAALIAHVVDAQQNGTTPENTVSEYLPVIHLTEAAYLSDAENRKIIFETEI